MSYVQQRVNYSASFGICQNNATYGVLVDPYYLAFNSHSCLVNCDQKEAVAKATQK